MVDLFEEVRRVLAPHGTCWVNLGDSYAGSGKGPSNNSPLDRPYRGMSNAAAAPSRWLSVPDGIKGKDLVGIPWRVAFALQDAGWYLRSDIVWSKPNPMPESVTDRPTKAHEYIFLLTKQPRYFFDQEAVRVPYTYDGRKVTTVEGKDGSLQHRKGERWPGIGKAHHKARGSLIQHGHDESEPMEINHGGRNVRTVWEIATQPYAEAHFATYPEELVRRCILAGCPEWVCRTCGKPRERRVVRTPLGTGPSLDPTKQTGRKGMNRERRPDEGTREITRAEQISYAQQLRESPHRAEMAGEAGSAFAHYVRVDESGARPVPPALLSEWLSRGWLVAPEQTGDCGHDDYRPGIVLDPFMGSGTTALVARKHDRRSIGVELNADYCALAARRLQQQSLFAGDAA